WHGARIHLFGGRSVMRSVISVTALAAAVAALLTGAVIAQQADRRQKLAPFGSDPDIQILAQARRSRSVSSRPDPAGNLPDRDTLNNGTVTVITAPVGGAFAAMGSDMANVLDDGENLRVLPIIGKGSVQNLIDIMRLRNVDMGFVVSDAVEFVKTEYHVP